MKKRSLSIGMAVALAASTVTIPTSTADVLMGGGVNSKGFRYCEVDLTGRDRDGLTALANFYAKISANYKVITDFKRKILGDLGFSLPKPDHSSETYEQRSQRQEQVEAKARAAGYTKDEAYIISYWEDSNITEDAEWAKYLNFLKKVLASRTTTTDSGPAYLRHPVKNIAATTDAQGKIVKIVVDGEATSPVHEGIPKMKYPYSYDYFRKGTWQEMVYSILGFGERSYPSPIRSAKLQREVGDLHAWANKFGIEQNDAFAQAMDYYLVKLLDLEGVCLDFASGYGDEMLNLEAVKNASIRRNSQGEAIDKSGKPTGEKAPDVTGQQGDGKNKPGGDPAKENPGKSGIGDSIVPIVGVGVVLAALAAVGAWFAGLIPGAPKPPVFGPM